MDLNMMLGYAGCACAVGLPASGSAIGCGIGGAASHGVMAKIEEGHGKFIGISAAPSSQTIYGIVLMFVLLGKISAGAGLALFGIGLFCGLGICISAIFQGKVAATAILASSKKPEIFGKCFAAVGITESFALFSMVFGLILAGGIG
ncbi:MAG: ATP synthase subunit C [Pseudomonadota bacterium]